MQFVILSLALCLGQTTPDSDAQAAIAIAAAKPAEKPHVKTTDPYQEAKQTAKEEGLPLVMYVGVDRRNLRSTVSVGIQAGRFVSDGYPVRCIIVSYPTGEWRATLSATATDAEIERALKGGEPVRAVPFPQGPAPPVADGSPWLAVSEQKKVRDMWPEGVPFPATLKFYSLPKASQQVATTNDRPSRGFHRNAGINLEYPYINSGGMDFAEKGTWRNVTGLSIPDGSKIRVFAKRTPILNSFGSYQSEEMLFWTFPTGTQAFDVLLKKNEDGTEHIFTVRVREKAADGWDDGASYFPDVPVSETSTYTIPGNARVRNVLGVETVRFKVAEVEPLERKRYRFKLSRTAISDGGHFTPKGFKGTGLTCTQCHVKGMMREDSPYAGPALRGQDTLFSWHPAKVASVDRDYFIPELDYRWPIAYLGDR